jgi:hypothetical protein
MGTVVKHFNSPKGRRSHIRLALQAMGGVFSAFIGGGMVVHMFALASMANPRCTGIERWTSIFQKLFLTLNVIPTALGGLMFFFGFTVAAVSFHRSATRGIGSNRPMVLAVTLLVIVVAMMMLCVVGFFL